MKRAPFFDKKYLSRVAIGVASALLAALGVFYLGFHMSSSLKEGIEVIYATSEIIPRSVTCEAYILRDETVIPGSAASGALMPAVSDGERVRSGSRIADIYSSASPSTQEKIALIEDQIDFYEKCADSHISVGDTSSVNKSLSSAVISIRRSVEAGNLSAVGSLKSSTVLDVRRLGVLTGRISDYSAVISELKSELATLKASLGSVSSTVYAPSSGYYFSSVDGYEEIFKIGDVDSLTYSGFMRMVEEASAAAPVTEGAYGKIAGDFRWYVACRLTSKEASAFEKDKSYSVTLENNAGEPLDMELCKVLSDGTESVAVFLCTRFPDGFDYSRCQSAILTKNTFTGYRIPTSALRVYEGMEGVFILDEVTVAFRRVSVAGEENGYFLCEIVTEDILEIPEDTSDAGSAETDAGSADTEDVTEETEEVRYYPYLKENDIVIVGGTGLYVGMTYGMN